MDTFDAIYGRRAVKHYDPDHKISRADEEKLLQAAMQSPTSFNIQHWRFVVVRDPDLRKEIRALGNDQAQMTEASLLIVITADVLGWAKDPARYWRDAPKDVADVLVDWMGPFHEGKEQLQRDEAQRSIGIALQTLMIAAKAMASSSPARCTRFGPTPRRTSRSSAPSTSGSWRARRPRCRLRSCSGFSRTA